MITDIAKTNIALSHISVYHAFFNIQDKALITTGRYLFKYTFVAIIYNKRKIEANTFSAVSGG